MKKMIKVCVTMKKSLSLMGIIILFSFASAGCIGETTVAEAATKVEVKEEVPARNGVYFLAKDKANSVALTSNLAYLQLSDIPKGLTLVVGELDFINGTGFSNFEEAVLKPMGNKNHYTVNYQVSPNKWFMFAYVDSRDNIVDYFFLQASK